MTFSIHRASVPVFVQYLRALEGVLAKGQAHAEGRGLNPATLLQGKLAPDMFPLTRQVQVASDFAARACARLSGAELPTYADDEGSFDELRARALRASDYVRDLPVAGFEGAEAREVTFPVGPGQTMTLRGDAYLLGYALPNFFFHCTTAYAILRNEGVEVGKRDFMGM